MLHDLERTHVVFHLLREGVTKLWCLGELPQPLEVAGLTIIRNQYHNFISPKIGMEPMEEEGPYCPHIFSSHNRRMILVEAMD